MIRGLRYLVALGLFAIAARWALEAIAGRATPQRPVIGTAPGPAGGRLELRVSPLTPAELLAALQAEPAIYAAAWAAASSTTEA